MTPLQLVIGCAGVALAGTTVAGLLRRDRAPLVRWYDIPLSSIHRADERYGGEWARCERTWARWARTTGG